MRIGNAGVEIIGGFELGGYIEMRHGQEYGIRITNNFSHPANATVSIDGKQLGTWRIPANSGISIERPANAQRKFTFYKSGTREDSLLDAIHPEFAGVVSVIVTPGVRVPDYSILQDSSPSPASFGGFTGQTMKGCSSGRTGLGSASSQRFGRAGHIDLDHSREITINLRLVCDNEQPAPLQDVRSNPVPPPIF